MLDALLKLIPDEKARNVGYTVAGMASLLTGSKLGSLALFAKGLSGLEKKWREAHPQHEGGVVERWNRAIHFYESTHINETNRKLHVVGIPMIVGGAAGLLLFVPFGPRWFISASSFTTGWVLNIIGHAAFEKNAPAFADDPLSFLAGPVWDLQHVFGKKAKVSRKEVFTADGQVTMINVEPNEPAQA
ncbi:MAG: DUF962 domain-containing protein [Deltaproteobacteria bacterium]|nr:DUF962 domain-containing protein [Deltaproteobacteria bacterium]